MRNYNMSSNMDAPCQKTNDSYRDRDFEVAMAYVPWQHFGKVYEPEKALMVGTIFPELDKPFCGRRVCRR